MSSETASNKEGASQFRLVAVSSQLEQLPAEIIQKIFNLLHLFDQSAQPDLIIPLSRSLAPFSNVALYESVQVSNDLDLETLGFTMLENSDLRGTIVSLSLINDDSGNEGESSGYVRLLERVLENMLISLTRLKTLEIGNWNMVGQVLLAGGLRGFGNAGGRALETIAIWNSFEDIPGPVSMALNSCRISFDLLHQLLSEIKKPEIDDFELELYLEMEVGTIGVSCRKGGVPELENGLLIPGKDWKLPEWNEEVMTRGQAARLALLARQNGVDLWGTIPEALKVERHFEEEKKSLMNFVKS